LTVIVGSYVSATIVSLPRDYNTLVKVGQICAKIEPRRYQTAVDQAKANIAVAKAQFVKDKANLDYAGINNQRLQQLVKQGSISNDAADQARNAFEQAHVGLDEATIELRRAELQAAQVNLDYTNILSPVDGRHFAQRDAGPDCRIEPSDSDALSCGGRFRRDAGRRQTSARATSAASRRTPRLPSRSTRIRSASSTERS
jgi:hypothetical protein